MQKISRGFTLIELLVVIAIIGILASIVLVSLGNARSSGADAGIKGNLDSIRTQAEVWASQNGNTYGTLATSSAACLTQTSGNIFADATIKQALTAASSSAPSSASIACGSTGTTWQVAVPLNSGGSWCVSSAGIAKSIPQTGTGALAAGAGCLN